jgi:hypothetical protein
MTENRILMNNLDELINNKEIFFRFLSERFPAFTGSNIFLRDIQYGIKFYFQMKDIKIKYPEAEKLALEFTNKLCETKDILALQKNTWRVDFVFKQEFEPTAEETVS